MKANLAIWDMVISRDPVRPLCLARLPGACRRAWNLIPRSCQSAGRPSEKLAALEYGWSVHYGSTGDFPRRGELCRGADRDRQDLRHQRVLSGPVARTVGIGGARVRSSLRSSPGDSRPPLASEHSFRPKSTSGPSWSARSRWCIVFGAGRSSRCHFPSYSNPSCCLTGGPIIFWRRSALKLTDHLAGSGTDVDLIFAEFFTFLARMRSSALIYIDLRMCLSLPLSAASLLDWTTGHDATEGRRQG